MCESCRRGKLTPLLHEEALGLKELTNNRFTDGGHYFNAALMIAFGTSIPNFT
jgi:hypothetical protein